MLRKLGNAAFMLLLVQLNVLIATDNWYGERDPFGPYPRIADKEKVKGEIEFAEECKKFYKPPKAVWFH